MGNIIKKKLSNYEFIFRICKCNYQILYYISKYQNKIKNLYQEIHIICYGNFVNNLEMIYQSMIIRLGHGLPF